MKASRSSGFVAVAGLFFAVVGSSVCSSGHKSQDPSSTSNISKSSAALVAGQSCFVAPPTSPPAWATNRAYTLGDLVTFDGAIYRARQPHTSLAGWEPPAVPALWLRPDACGVEPWTPQTDYRSEAVVTHGSSVYRLRQPHVSLPGWEPPAAPALWQLLSSCDTGTAAACSVAVDGDVTRLRYSASIRCDNQVVALDHASTADPAARTGQTETSVTRDGALVIVTATERQGSTAGSQVAWGLDFVTGAQLAVFDSDGVTVTGSIDGRAIVPVPVEHAGSTGAFQFQDGNPAPSVEVGDAVAGQVSLLEAKARRELAAGVCGQAAAAPLAGVGLASGSGGVAPGSSLVAAAVGGPNCDNCRSECDGEAVLCDLAAAASCFATFGFGCIGFAVCSLEWGQCQSECEEAGGPCCPVKCGNGSCCEASETCTLGGGRICCPFASACGNQCCGSNQSCQGGAQCCNNDKLCGPSCCAAGTNCIDPAAGTCCSPGNSCGTACCGPGQRCEDPAANRCVACDIVCGGECCGTGQVCAGTTCCSPARACGNTCCASGTTCTDPVAGVCVGGQFAATAQASAFLTGGPLICGSGTLFTPGGGVSVSYHDIPRRGPIGPIRIATADAGGNFSFTDTTLMSVDPINNCTPEEIFLRPRADFLDEATGRVVSDEFVGCFCANTICNIQQCGGR